MKTHKSMKHRQSFSYTKDPEGLNTKFQAKGICKVTGDSATKEE